MEQLGRFRATLGLGLVLGTTSACAEGAGAADGVFNPPSVNNGSSDTDGTGGSGTQTDGADSTTAVGSTGRDEPDPTLPDPPPMECPIGAESCDCTPGGACDDGLTCEGGTCVVAPPECGNGMLETGEECDHGVDNSNQAQCKSDCTEQFCGDGFVGPGEGCDDGNADDTDACTSQCALASCGDGITQMGEACDDGNADDTDACLSTCTAAICGDAIVQQGVEECDDGNASDADGCLSSCLNASCGDGFIQQGVETCDDGNGVDTDGCTNACTCGVLTFAAAGDISGWTMNGGWGLYTQAPASSHPAVTFSSQVFGTDGNRVPPYPGSQAETSAATTGSFVIPETITFRSWHVDEGSGSYDTKRILVSTDGGASWSALVDCNVGPNAGLPFCVYQGGPRAADLWDEVEIDAGVFGGETGRIRIEYDTGDSCCSFEQGWFIDDANFRTCG